ncbi:MAG: acyltransferase [Coriobacteriales bacterium]|nr:acyltransferase [Coriobacteriales bacterium]
MGSNVHFNGAMITGGGGLSIGDNFHSGRDLRIMTANHRWKGATELPYDSEIELRPVTIEDNVWLGERVTVLPGAFIGEGAIVGAGAVVSGRIEPLSVAAGVPARPVGERDREHYESVKAAGRFH